MPRRPRQLDRQRIIDAARASLAKDGEAGLSLRKLAATMGVTAPALYLYVSSKQDLLQEVADTEFGACIDKLQQIAKTDADPLDRIRQQADTYVRWAADNPDLFRSLFLTQPALAATSAGDQVSLVARAYAAVAGPVDEASASGQIHDPDGLGAATAVWTAIHGTATAVVTGMVDAPTSALIEGVIETALFGLADAPARA